MEDIISLADLLTRQKIHQAQLVDELKNNENKMAELYNLILDGKIRSDEDAIDVLYGGNVKLDTFKKLKSRLYDRMINSIFFIDQSGPNFKDIFIAAKTCYKNYAAAKLLWGNQKARLAAQLSEKTLPSSMRFEFTDLNYLFTSILSTYYLKYAKNQNKFKKYSELKKRFLFELSAENDIEEIFGAFGIDLSKTSSGLENQQIEFYKKYLNEFRSQQKTIRTMKFNLNAYLFQANFFLELKEYDKLLEIANEGIQFFNKKNIKSLPADYTLRTRLALANFLLKKYDQAETLFYKNLSITNPSTSNYYATYNFLFSLYIVQKKYDKAYEIISKVFSYKEFEKRAHPLLVQLWKVKEAYTHFLVDLGKIDHDNIQEHSMRKFRLGRFLNDIPSYSKDKRGVNISILVIQLILLVQTKKYDQIIDKLDALNMYCHRYLRADKTFRSNCFIKMLMKLPDADYHPIRWARYVKKLRNKLDEHPFELSYHNLDLEVIPYEHLYDLVIEMLEKQKGLFKTAS